MEEKYLRIISQSLLSYGRYLELVAEDDEKIGYQLEKTKDFHSKIIGDGKFWKLAHHNNAPVRRLPKYFLDK